VESRIRQHIARLNEPFASKTEYLQSVLAELRTASREAMLPALTQCLHDPDGECRVWAAELVLRLLGVQGIPMVLPHFENPVDWVRWHVVGMMHTFGDESALAPLVIRLRSDPEPGVRTQAAYALGGIGSPSVIPLLLEVMEQDHEADSQGHTPSSVAATALDEIVGTNHTRIKVTETLRTLAPWPPDLEALKSAAQDCYTLWLRGGQLGRTTRITPA
jgi:hypothetical protein